MVKIVIENMGQKEVTGKAGTLALRLLHENFVDWMHACGGKGRCTTCKMIIVNGTDSLGTLTDVEARYRSVGELAVTERLACQTKILGDCTVRTPAEYKLPHQTYTD
ncbi:MAG: (2Fe-2S)-binding protein [Cyclobacteriaceae bacterium]|nr:(2Fe-2S)-binding protein [Cyclobacteriaceae bacterium]